MPEDSRKAELLEQAKAHLFRSSKDFGEPIIARGQGATIVDTDGKEYLDFGLGSDGRQYRPQPIPPSPTPCSAPPNAFSTSTPTSSVKR